jgi:hypothetical protein
MVAAKAIYSYPAMTALPATLAILVCARVSLLLALVAHNVALLSAQSRLDPEQAAQAFQGIVATAINPNPQEYPQIGI